MVRSFAKRALTDLGYEILEARDANEALEIAPAHKDKIQFLMTDVIMPAMSCGAGSTGEGV